MFKIAVSGKGGVGKTTISATLARFLARKGYEVLAIDADPSMNLASSLGIKNPPPLTMFKELIDERAGGMDGVFRLNPKVDDIVERFGVVGKDNVKLLVLGTIKKGGEGCMCPASSFLKALLRHIILKTNSVVVMDMEAGIEHLGRGITRGMDIMLIVVEPGARSIETAKRIKELAQEINIKRFGTIINKARNDSKEIMKKLHEHSLPVIGVIPYDASLIQADINNIAPIDIGGKAVEAIKQIWEKIDEQHR